MGIETGLILSVYFQLLCLLKLQIQVQVKISIAYFSKSCMNAEIYQIAKTANLLEVINSL
jgi:hypothetical protein